MGRPPMQPKDRRTRGLTLRFTRDEFRELQGDARAAGVTVTEFLRQCWRKER